jgi:hypothetical protein
MGFNIFLTNTLEVHQPSAFVPGADARDVRRVTIDGFLLTGRQRMCSGSLIHT